MTENQEWFLELPAVRICKNCGKVVGEQSRCGYCQCRKIIAWQAQKVPLAAVMRV